MVHKIVENELTKNVELNLKIHLFENKILNKISINI